MELDLQPRCWTGYSARWDVTVLGGRDELGCQRGHATRRDQVVVASGRDLGEVLGRLYEEAAAVGGVVV